jgi:hypothetical protein
MRNANAQVGESIGTLGGHVSFGYHTKEDDMPTESRDSTATLLLETTSTTIHDPPSWFPELATLAQWFVHRQLLPLLDTTLRLVRRVDATCPLDVVLLLLAALVAHASLQRACEQLGPVRHLLPALWARNYLASRPAVSRFLAALTVPVMDSMQTLFCLPSASTACRASTKAA